MTERTMRTIYQSMDANTATNALYELMLDWRRCMIDGNTEERRWIEKVLSRFCGTTSNEMRSLLAEHFGTRP